MSTPRARRSHAFFTLRQFAIAERPNAIVVIEMRRCDFAIVQRQRLLVAHCICNGRGHRRRCIGQGCRHTDGFLLLLGRFLVGLLVEIVEQEIEEYAVGQREEDRPSRVAAIGVDQLGGMQEGQTELDLQERGNYIKLFNI